MEHGPLSAQIEQILGRAGYDAWPHTGGELPITCFEDEAVAGFVHFFPDVDSLISRWKESEMAVLRRYAASLRAGGDKSWNIYSILLCSENASPAQAVALDAIEEDFEATRKIARTGVQTMSDAMAALQPLLPIQSSSRLGESDFEQRLRGRLPNVPSSALDALLGSASVIDTLHIVEEDS